MHLDEYRDYDLVGLSELVAGDEVRAEELFHVARSAMEQVEPELHAVADGPWDSPLAHDPRGVFRGAPFVVKDLLCHPRERALRLGSRLTGDGLAMGHDTHLMGRFRAAGLATVGLTTTPELGFGPTNEALVYGPTRNPWDRTRSTGGSSGGSCALVAARAVPAGHGSDGAGSIRIPAAACGLVGLKPSRGRVSAGPDTQQVVFGLAIEFGVTRSVRDTAALLDAVSGPMPGDHVRIAPPIRPFRDEVGADPGRLRVAVHTDPWFGTEVDAEVRAAVERVASELEDHGHVVGPATPKVDWEALADTHVKRWSVGLAEAVGGISATSGLQPSEDTVERVTLAAARHGAELTALDLAATWGTENEISRTVGDFFTEWDVLLTPTINTPAFPLGQFDQNDAGVGPDDWIRSVFDACAFTPLFNLTGTPAISLPLATSQEGLPIGVQLAAGMGEEAALLRLASQLEAALPWKDRMPPIRAGS